MKTITSVELETVTGGTAANDALNTQLTSLQSSIKDLATAQAKPATDPSTMMMMMMAMQPKDAPTVVAPAAPAVAPGPIVNVNTRVGRRHW